MAGTGEPDQYPPLNPLVVYNAFKLPTTLPTAVTKESEYNWFGPFDLSALTESACHFVISNSATKEQSIEDREKTAVSTAGIIDGFLYQAVNDCLSIAHPSAPQDRITQACWLTVRMRKPTDEFVTPRWHQDGRMFPCTCHAPTSPPLTDDELAAEVDRDWPAEIQRHHSKYALTLLGPPTRLIRPSAQREHGVAAFVSGDEGEARSATEEEELGLPVQRGQVIRFSWGQDDSPVHSEPDWSGLDRIFVSVMFGTEREIRVMAKFRNMPYGEVAIE